MCKARLVAVFPWWAVRERVSLGPEDVAAYVVTAATYLQRETAKRRTP